MVRAQFHFLIQVAQSSLSCAAFLTVCILYACVHMYDKNLVTQKSSIIVSQPFTLMFILLICEGLV